MKCKKIFEGWKRFSVSGIAALCLLLTGFQTQQAPYQSITMEEAGEIFEEDGEYVIVDVRREDEFAGGHIENAVNIPNETIQDDETDLSELLPDKDQEIYVYCRSGNRSKQASEKLVELGYTAVIEFGGIIDWTGEVVTEPESEIGAISDLNNPEELLGIWEDEDQIYALEILQDESYHAVLFRKNQKVFDREFSLTEEEGYVKLTGFTGEMLNADCNNLNIVDHAFYEAEENRMELSVTYQGKRSVIYLEQNTPAMEN